MDGQAIIERLVKLLHAEFGPDLIRDAESADFEVKPCDAPGRLTLGKHLGDAPRPRFGKGLERPTDLPSPSTNRSRLIVEPVSA